MQHVPVPPSRPVLALVIIVVAVIASLVGAR
jgi:hypothetical protein